MTIFDVPGSFNLAGVDGCGEVSDGNARKMLPGMFGSGSTVEMGCSGSGS